MTAPFTKPVTALVKHIDELGHVNNAVWVRWIQELAAAHWHAGASSTQVAAYIWVVTRHEIDYRRPVRAGETVIGRTWVEAATRGARFDRLTEFVGTDGRLRVRACTTWAMLDRATGRPLRITPEIAAPFFSADKGAGGR